MGTFKRDFRIEFQEQTRDEIIFDMVGADAAIANAFRRVLLAEVSLKRSAPDTDHPPHPCPAVRTLRGSPG